MFYLYLPSKADKERCEKLAEKANTPLSTFVLEIVENSLSEDVNFKPRVEIMREIATFGQENKELRDDLRQKRIVIERYEDELKRYPTPHS